MACHKAIQLWVACSIATLLTSAAMAQTGPSIPVKYCANANTADMTPFRSDFQSQGRCFQNCTDASYALAIVQAKLCWCSNLVPRQADQRPLNDCTQSCPGYPSDYCGGPDTFGYMELRMPSGTMEPEAATTPTSTSLSDKGPLPVPEPTIQTVTVGGVIRTVTATPSVTAGTTVALAPPPSSGLSTGAAVGIAVGVVGIFAVGAIFLFMYWLKRKRMQSEGGLFTGSRRGSSPGMLSTPNAGDVSEVRFGDGQGAPGWENGQSAKRRSHLMPIDPRLDPFAKGIYARDQNKSHDSISSFQDNQDYSRRIHDTVRVLRATNPDPADD